MIASYQKYYGLLPIIHVQEPGTSKDHTVLGSEPSWKVHCTAKRFTSCLQLSAAASSHMGALRSSQPASWLPGRLATSANVQLPSCPVNADSVASLSSIFSESLRQLYCNPLREVSWQQNVVQANGCSPEDTGKGVLTSTYTSM